MAENFRHLNQDKTKVLIIGLEAQREKLNVKLQALTLISSHQVKASELFLIQILALSHTSEIVVCTGLKIKSVPMNC